MVWFAKKGNMVHDPTVHGTMGSARSLSCCGLWRASPLRICQRCARRLNDVRHREGGHRKGSGLFQVTVIAIRVLLLSRRARRPSKADGSDNTPGRRCVELEHADHAHTNLNVLDTCFAKVSRSLGRRPDKNRNTRRAQDKPTAASARPRSLVTFSLAFFYSFFGISRAAGFGSGALVTQCLGRRPHRSTELSRSSGVITSVHSGFTQTLCVAGSWFGAFRVC